MAKRLWASRIVAVVASLLLATAAFGAGAKGGGKDKSATSVSWASSVDAAKQSAGEGPFALFFCSEEAAKFAGEGAKAVKERGSKHAGKPLPLTPFEQESVLQAVKDSGVPIAKVPMTKEHADVIKKYGVATDPALLLCAPTGELITGVAGPDCNPANVTNLFRAAKEACANWRKAHPAKPEKAGLKEEPKKEGPKAGG